MKTKNFSDDLMSRSLLLTQEMLSELDKCMPRQRVALQRRFSLRNGSLNRS